MKKFSVFIVFLMVSTFGCSNSSDSKPDNLYTKYLTTDTWIVSLYTHDAIDSNTPGIDSTQDYVNYVLKFNPNGTLVVTKGDETINGSWRVTLGNLETFSYLILNFDTTGSFKNLNASWIYYGNFPNEINLRVDFKDFLTLTK